jgi:hypothetical protein
VALGAEYAQLRRLAGRTEGAKIEGARAPKGRLPIANAGSLVMAKPCSARTPAAVFIAGRGCGTRRKRASGPTRRFRRGADIVRGPRAAAGARINCRAPPLAKGCRARRHGGAMLRMDAGNAQPRTSAPSSEGASSRQRCERSSAPQPGTGPAPQQTLKLGASLVDRVAGSMGEVVRAGRSFVAGREKRGVGRWAVLSNG